MDKRQKIEEITIKTWERLVDKHDNYPKFDPKPECVHCGGKTISLKFTETVKLQADSCVLKDIPPVIRHICETCGFCWFTKTLKESSDGNNE
jgi:hypothetical protein